MEEEFEEADILWSNSDHDAVVAAEKRDLPPQENRRKFSIPIQIPSKLRPFVIDRGGDDGLSEGVGKKENGGYRIPPHVVLVRRISDEVSSSVCVGTGRTLKGRDLRTVRNSVLRMTGFLEA